MAHRSNGRGSLRVDRIFPVVGRIARSSGTSYQKTFKKINDMLDDLHDRAEYEVLRNIQKGSLSLTQAFELWRKGAVSSMRSSAHLLSVASDLVGWNSRRQVAPTTIKNDEFQIRRFLKSQGDMSIADLPQGLSRYKQECHAADSPDSFNRFLKLIKVYLGSKEDNLLDDDGLLRVKVGDIKKLKPKPTKKARKWGPREMINLVNALPEPHRGMARTMLFTGMHWKEYAENEWGVENTEVDGGVYRVVRIRGTKTDFRDRYIPEFDHRLELPSRSYPAFRKALKAVHGDLQPLSFRSTFAQWLEASGIDHWRVQRYMGHSPGTMTQGYQTEHGFRFMEDDKKRLLKYVEDQIANDPVVVSEPQTMTGFLLHGTTRRAKQTAPKSTNPGKSDAESLDPVAVVRRMLYGAGFRYRLRQEQLPGVPDIVLPKYKTAIFVRSCLVHSHNCSDGKMAMEKSAPWQKKASEIRQRAAFDARMIQEKRWHAITVWECETKGNTDVLLSRLKEQLSAVIEAEEKSATRDR